MKRALAAAATFALLLTACGPDLGSGRTACQLITKTDIQNAVPEMRSTTNLDNGTKERSDCYFTGKISETGSMNVWVTLDRVNGRKIFETGRKNASRTPGHKVIDQRGLGDEAFIDQPPARTAATVYVRSDDALLTVYVSSGFDTPKRTLQLARIGLSRL